MFTVQRIEPWQSSAFQQGFQLRYDLDSQVDATLTDYPSGTAYQSFTERKSFLIIMVARHRAHNFFPRVNIIQIAQFDQFSFQRDQ